MPLSIGPAAVFCAVLHVRHRCRGCHLLPLQECGRGRVLHHPPVRGGAARHGDCHVHLLPCPDHDLAGHAHFRGHAPHQQRQGPRLLDGLCLSGNHHSHRLHPLPVHLPRVLRQQIRQRSQHGGDGHWHPPPLHLRDPRIFQGTVTCPTTTQRRNTNSHWVSLVLVPQGCQGRILSQKVLWQGQDPNKLFCCRRQH